MGNALYEIGDRVQFDAPLRLGRRVAGIDRVQWVHFQTRGHQVFWNYDLESGLNVRECHILKKLPDTEMG